MSASSNQQFRRTLIQKVVVLGTNPALMAGYINQVSGTTIAYHLYSTLGVGIGVARTQADSGDEVVLQLWLIPNDEKMPGLNKSFAKGHTGAIIVLRGNETEQLAEILSNISEEAHKGILVVVVGSESAAENALNVVSDSISSVPRIDYHVNPREALSHLGNALVTRRKNRIPTPLVVCMAEDECPEYHHVQGFDDIPECSIEEIEYIKEIAMKIGAEVDIESAAINKPEGVFTVNIKTGDVSILPVSCQLCESDCKRNSGICIVESTSGWSSEGMGKRSLLILAKIWGIHSNELPNHVRKQIRYAIQCNRFLPRADLKIQEIEEAMEALGYERSQKRKSLLEEASARVSDRRISQTIFDMLKRRLDIVHDKIAREGN